MEPLASHGSREATVLRLRERCSRSGRDIHLWNWERGSGDDPYITRSTEQNRSLAMSHLRRSSVVVAGTVGLTAVLAMSLSAATSTPGQRAQSTIHNAKAGTLKLTLRDGPETVV